MEGTKNVASHNCSCCSTVGTAPWLAERPRETVAARSIIFQTGGVEKHSCLILGISCLGRLCRRKERIRFVCRCVGTSCMRVGRTDFSAAADSRAQAEVQDGWANGWSSAWSRLGDDAVWQTIYSRPVFMNHGVACSRAHRIGCRA
jgi:hypothetical protein